MRANELAKELKKLPPDTIVMIPVFGLGDIAPVVIIEHAMPGPGGWVVLDTEPKKSEGV